MIPCIIMVIDSTFQSLNCSITGIFYMIFNMYSTGVLSMTGGSFWILPPDLGWTSVLKQRNWNIIISNYKTLKLDTDILTLTTWHCMIMSLCHRLKSIIRSVIFGLFWSLLPIVIFYFCAEGLSFSWGNMLLIGDNRLGLHFIDLYL